MTDWRIYSKEGGYNPRPAAWALYGAAFAMIPAISKALNPTAGPRGIGGFIFGVCVFVAFGAIFGLLAWLVTAIWKKAAGAIRGSSRQ